jgi:hypothetical protein
MVTYVPVTSAVPKAAYSEMNWAEARYYGLGIASLQNGAGSFVAPSKKSLDAAISVAKHNKDGSLTPDYKSTNIAQYPMTSVVYAAVCADAITTTSANHIRTVLNGIVSVTGNQNGATTLVNGFVPLTPTLVSQAKSDIATDIHGGGKTPNAHGCTTSTNNGGHSTTTTTTKTGTLVTTSSTIPTNPSHPGGPPPKVISTTKTPPPGSGTPTNPVQVPQLLADLAESASALFLPVAGIIGVLALVFGFALVVSERLRRMLYAALVQMKRRANRVVHRVVRWGRLNIARLRRTGSGFERTWS